MPEMTQLEVYDQQVKAWESFQAEQEAVTAAQQKPLAQVLKALKGVAGLPEGLLTGMNVYGASLAITLPKVLFPHVQKLDDWYQGRLDRAIEELTAVPEGKLLVEQAKKDGVIIRGVNQAGPGGLKRTYHKENKETGQIEFKTIININLFQTHGSMVGVVAHELQHYNQTKNGLGGHPDLVRAPLDRLWDNRMVEADAEATSTDIAYKLKQAGKPAAWASATQSNLGYSAVAKAYAKEVGKDPSSAEDGRAKRAAFDGWFKARNKFENLQISKLYNAQGMGHFSKVETIALNATKDGAQISPLTTAEIKKLGATLPAKNNYLDLPKQKPLDSAFYREQNFDKQDMERIQFGYDDYSVLKTNSAFMKKPVTVAPVETAATMSAPVQQASMAQKPKTAPVSLARAPRQPRAPRI